MRQLPKNNRAGYTLLELAVSLAAGSFLVVGLGASLLISSRMVTPPDRVRNVLDASRAAFRFTDEIRYATYIISRTDKMIHFVVADRTGDGEPDIIRYEWTGTAGEPLTRTINGGDPDTILDDVREFVLTYDVKTGDEEIPTYVESQEQVLSSWNGASGLAEMAITSGHWCGEYFEPTLPAGALHWKVTKATIKASYSITPDGETYVQLRPGTGAMTPTSTVLDQASMLETLLTGNPEWQQLSFSSASQLPPETGLCLVLKFASGIESCKVEYQASGASLPNAAFLESANQGASWTSTTDKALQHFIHGTYTSIGPPQIVTRDYLTGVNLSLRAGNDSQSGIDTATPVLNSPELLSGYWKLDFDGDPTAADVNFDGDPDWELTDDQDPGLLSMLESVLQLDSGDGIQLNTSPPSDFAKLTTVELNCRNTSVGGLGAVLRMYVDRSGSTSGVLYSTVTLEADGTQTVRVFAKTDVATDVKLAEMAGLSDKLVHLRFVVNPDADTVAAWIDDAWAGTHSYSTFSNNGESYFQIAADGSSAEFDYISIRVAE